MEDRQMSLFDALKEQGLNVNSVGRGKNGFVVGCLDQDALDKLPEVWFDTPVEGRISKPVYWALGNREDHP